MMFHAYRVCWAVVCLAVGCGTPIELAPTPNSLIVGTEQPDASDVVAPEVSGYGSASDTGAPKEEPFTNWKLFGPASYIHYAERHDTPSGYPFLLIKNDASLDETAKAQRDFAEPMTRIACAFGFRLAALPSSATTPNGMMSVVLQTTALTDGSKIYYTMAAEIRPNSQLRFVSAGGATFVAIDQAWHHITIELDPSQHLRRVTFDGARVVEETVSTEVVLDNTAQASFTLRPKIGETWSAEIDHPQCALH